MFAALLRNSRVNAESEEACVDGGGVGAGIGAERTGRTGVWLIVLRDGVLVCSDNEGDSVVDDVTWLLDVEGAT